MAKKILVTGGAGFIGSHLCELLLRSGHTVICLDSLSTGRKQNIKHLFRNENFTFIKHDITAPYFCKVNEIYHLACPASPYYYQKHPIETLKANVVGTLNLLELAVKVKAKILQASTSEVYGDPLRHPQGEDYWGNVNPIGLRACYDEGKRCAETACLDYHRKYGVAVKIVRIFNTYGPRMAAGDGRVVSNFIVQAIQNKPITIYGTGDQTRSFQYVEDLVPGIVKMMEKDGLVGPVNLGSPEEVTMKELAKKVIALTKSKSALAYKPLPADDPKKRKPNIQCAERKLHWRPTTGLEEGLAKTIRYFKSHYGYC